MKNIKISVFLLVFMVSSISAIFASSSLDSLIIEVMDTSIKLNKRNHGIRVKLSSSVNSIYTRNPVNVVPTVSSESYSCMTRDQWRQKNDSEKQETYRAFSYNIYVFIYDDTNTRIYPGYHFFCERFYYDFNKLLELGILKICLLDYSLSSGQYKLKLIYYSGELDQCLVSNIVRFKVED